ncbi:helix-turn-helix transcriptional regulator [Paraburkholderia bengalensis]|uniref:Helix-turn-helix transcriptional regulator n=1 Tax=Paraburkholderia bengalensis TaxID=2747562 RepID=A0ABU8J0B4_9BURK
MDRAILRRKPNERSSARNSIRNSCAAGELVAIEAARDLMLATPGYGLSIDAIAVSVHMSKRHFLRLFKRVTGTTPHSWRMEKRVRGSMVDLRNGDLSLTQIAHQYGFADHAHYTRVFKRIVGTPPSVWRVTAVSDSTDKFEKL